MSYVQYNPNPHGRIAGDCAIRAIAKATDQPWTNAYTALTLEGYLKGDLPNANHVWGDYLRKKGFKKYIIPDTCPECYTVAEFAKEHPKGMYVLALNDHVVAVNDGDVFDAWDSSAEPVLYFWRKEN